VQVLISAYHPKSQPIDETLSRWIGMNLNGSLERHDATAKFWLETYFKDSR